jgi:hypothetical protein
VSHDKTPVEVALELAVFGPLGLALCAKDAVPGWVDTGRRRVLHQVDVARVVGEHATRHGQKLVADTLVSLGILPGPPPPPTRFRGPNLDGGSAASTAGDGPGDPAPAPPQARSRRTANARGPVPSPNADPGPAGLAIPGYDSLSASQVVARLAGLAPGELEAVRAYESATRGRRTVLTKISQLQTGRS